MNCMHTRTNLEGHQLCIFLEGAEEGMQIEQERIIRVLDEQLGKLDYADLIALIKGDK